MIADKSSVPLFHLITSGWTQMYFNWQSLQNSYTVESLDFMVALYFYGILW